MIVNPVNSLKYSKKIADPIHGMIRLTNIEEKILQHRVFQRLRNITQLGLAKYVYPGAMHTRFTHSLGVVQNITLMMDAIYRNYQKYPQLFGNIDEDLVFGEEQLQILRLAAMCHDLGHFPFSHNIEPAFKWLFAKKIIKQPITHEDLSASIVENLLDNIIKHYTSETSNLILGNYSNFNSLFMNFMISGAIDADRMDYLVRDALHCGVDHGYFDKNRLLDSLIVFNTNILGKNTNLLGFRSKGIEAVEQFLLARHRMHQTIYYNSSVVSFEAAIKRAYYRITTENSPWPLPDEFIQNPELFINFDEYSLFYIMRKELIKRNSWLSRPVINRNPIIKYGPYFHTISTEIKKTSNQNEIIKSQNHLRIIKELIELEDPINDWDNKDHWVYIENKKQKLIDPIPKYFYNENIRYSDAKNLKNVIMLINDNRNLIDLTKVDANHSFLPYITGKEYHRYLFFTNKENNERLENKLKPIIDYERELYVKL